ncbi:hypothetical protein [Haloglycomyces albus]|uniref:hypothetical protein n=1 Tax=Haloglycomyces albus TaxID=526067 RepID=UPI00046D31FD|nr:hypothetical protein [Haloglycomyces albus]
MAQSPPDNFNPAQSPPPATVDSPTRPPYSKSVAVVIAIQLFLALAIILQTVGIWKFTGEAIRGFSNSIEDQVRDVAQTIALEKAEDMGVDKEEAKRQAEAEVEEKLEEADIEGAFDQGLESVGLETDDLNPPTFTTLPFFFAAGMLILSALLLATRRKSGRIISFILHPFLFVGCGLTSFLLVSIPVTIKQGMTSAMPVSLAGPVGQAVDKEIDAIAGSIYGSYPVWFQPAMYATLILSTVGSIAAIVLLVLRGARQHFNGPQ